MANNMFQILAIPGSLRRTSYNRGLIHAAQDVAPDGVEIVIYELHDLPLYNADEDVDGGPEPVQAFKAAIRAADALLIATPEYNYSIPGVLKNALDWASRPPPTSPLRHKPIALMGTSSGGFGTVRAQLALRQVLVFTESYPLIKPELMVSNAHDHFDAEGHLTNPDTRERVRALLHALIAWTRRLAA